MTFKRFNRYMVLVMEFLLLINAGFTAFQEKDTFKTLVLITLLFILSDVQEKK